MRSEEELLADLEGARCREDLLAVLLALKGRESARAHFVRARAYFMLSQDSDALLEYDAAISSDGSMHEAVYHKGVLLRYMGRREEAVAMLRESLELSYISCPSATKSTYALSLAQALMSVERVEEAAQRYREATELNPESFQAHAGFGACLMQQGREEQGIGAMRAAVALIPTSGATKEHVTCLFNLGTALAKRHEWDAALDLLLQATRASPEDWHVWSKVIQCHSALGNKEMREEAIRRLVALHSSGAVPVPRFCREQIMTERGNVLMYEYFEFSGEFGSPVLLALPEQPSTDPRHPQYVQLGSYDDTTKISRELGTITEAQRMWHVDGYYPGGGHVTFMLSAFSEQPSYDDVRQLMIDGVEGKAAVRSSFTPGR